MKEAAGIMPISQLGPGEPVDWLVEGYVARGYKTLYSAFWKSGKTTFLANLLKMMGKGGMIADFYVKPAKVVLISEENPGLWANRREFLGLEDHIWIGCQPFIGVATLDIWNNYILNAIAPLIEKKGFDLVVFDTYNKLSPILDENASGPAKQALAVMSIITELGAALMLSCHTRKGDSATGQATRGSGFIMGDVDIIIEMDRKEAEKPFDRRRVLKAQSRFDETPPEKVIELAEDGQSYEYVGDQASMPFIERLPVMQRLVNRCKECVPEVLLALWRRESTAAPPGLKQFKKDLKQGVDDGYFQTVGRGVKGDSYRYVLVRIPDSSPDLLFPPPRGGAGREPNRDSGSPFPANGDSFRLSTPSIGKETKEQKS